MVYVKGQDILCLFSHPAIQCSLLGQKWPMFRSIDSACAAKQPGFQATEMCALFSFHSSCDALHKESFLQMDLFKFAQSKSHVFSFFCGLAQNIFSIMATHLNEYENVNVHTDTYCCCKESMSLLLLIDIQTCCCEHVSYAAAAWLGIHQSCSRNLKNGIWATVLGVCGKLERFYKLYF